MFHTLCHPVVVIQIHGLPDGRGGFREAQMPPVNLWASIKPASLSKVAPLKEGAYGPRGAGGGRSSPPGPSSLVSSSRFPPERYEVHLRDYPFSGMVHEIHWGAKILKLLTPLGPAAKAGYVVCQAMAVCTQSVYTQGAGPCDPFASSSPSSASPPMPIWEGVA
jgi:hypothetical protein